MQNNEKNYEGVESEETKKNKKNHAQKWSFPLRISSVNVTKSTGNCRFGHIY